MEKSFAREVFQQINKLRRFPLTFVPFLEERLGRYRGTVLTDGANQGVQTAEGIVPVSLVRV